MALDLDSRDGQRTVRELACRADVLIESARPAVQGARGLDVDELRGDNEQLTYLSITAFGRSGPKAC